MTHRKNAAEKPFAQEIRAADGNPSARWTCETLYAAFGPQGWWPVAEPGGTAEYKRGRNSRQLSENQRFEVAVGSILAQNTSWNNAAKAVENLRQAKLVNAARLTRANVGGLAELMRPSGYYRQKAARLKTLAAFWVENTGFEKLETAVMRRKLLELNGVGPETADSILLYAFGRPVFVVDAYTRRIFGRTGVCRLERGDEGIVRIAGEAGFSLMELAEFHALLVQLAKKHCLKRNPACTGCPLATACRFARNPE
ncbi:MAG: endonuclease [Candidatus Micrarchaeota archaeon]